MLARGLEEPSCVINDGAAPSKVNTGLSAEELVRKALFTVRPVVRFASKVTVGVMSKVGGGGGGGGGSGRGGTRRDSAAPSAAAAKQRCGHTDAQGNQNLAPSRFDGRRA